jgi:hypothetical protein
MSKHKQEEKVVMKPCLGWCNKMIPYHGDPADRYCPKCRAIKDNKQRALSRIEHNVADGIPSYFSD